MGGDGEYLSGFRVADFLGGAENTMKDAEAVKGETVSPREGVRRSFKEEAEEAGGFSPGKGKLFRESAGEFPLVHRLTRRDFFPPPAI